MHRKFRLSSNRTTFTESVIKSEKIKYCERKIYCTCGILLSDRNTVLKTKKIYKRLLKC